jgi:hypothetical protein
MLTSPFCDREFYDDIENKLSAATAVVPFDSSELAKRLCLLAEEIRDEPLVARKNGVNR